MIANAKDYLFLECNFALIQTNGFATIIASRNMKKLLRANMYAERISKLFSKFHLFILELSHLNEQKVSINMYEVFVYVAL